MKKVIILALSILLTVCSFQQVFANETGGSGNIDSGGGGLGSGNSENRWSGGNEGVRITVVRAADHVPVTEPIDFTNKQINSIQVHFGKVSKISYNSGTALVPTTSKYPYINPGRTMPCIVSPTGRNNITEIKKYFCSEYVIKRIAEVTGMNYDILIGGQYKILLEPIAYYTFQGVMIATTATEAALYDEQTGGMLRRRIPSLSHKNLPLAMFLEVSDLGYPAWTGKSNTIY